MEVAGEIVGAGVVVVLAVVWLASVVRKQQQGGRLPPGPRGLPIVGNLLHLLGSELPHRAMAELSKKYGPIVYLRMGQAPMVLISDSKLAKAVLSGPIDKAFANRPSMEVMRRLTFGTSVGIATAPYGDEWRQARKLCNVHLFSSSRVSELEPIRRGEIGAVLQKIKDRVHGDESSQPMNISQTMSSLVESITCKVLLGKPSLEIGDAGSGINMHLLIQRVNEAFQIPFLGDFFPALGFLDGKARAMLDEVRAGFNILIDNLVLERQQCRPKDSSTVILDVLLDNLDIDRVKSIVLELLVGSIDTTLTVINWAMAELIASPKAMQTLQKEIEMVAKKKLMIIEEGDLASLQYIKAVVKETMRLHAPVPLLLPHMSVEKCTVAGYTIPKGVRLLVNVWAIGRDPKIWENPDTFLPERFLTNKGLLVDLRGQHFDLLPFGSGRRICPGMPLAIPIVESILANLVHNFDWQLPPGLSLDMSEHFGNAVGLANPLYAIPSLRR